MPIHDAFRSVAATGSPRRAESRVVFAGGSRKIARLPDEIRPRLDNIVAAGHALIVGDASGADEAVQAYCRERRYPRVTVFYSGAAPRRNLGAWPCRAVAAEGRGFAFHAAKDRAMADAADFGLMIWDGESPGTLLNVLRLARAGKTAVLFDDASKRTRNVKTPAQFAGLLEHVAPAVRAAARARASADEWSGLPVDGAGPDSAVR
jgi:adenine-specific DNA-methyltransferase